ncbi:phage antirepressor [Clostridium sp.]|uniref:phage antirepressor n=1 Tax=Clostridium sp. TaxID=1506 RepID=UPI003217200C
MNNIQIFKNEDFGQVRLITREGEPWFVGKDIAEILGYTNSRKALLDHVEQEDKFIGDGVTIRDSIGREQSPVVINESGLYSLILSSKLPSAKKFKRWVTSDVLPSIRKTGGYLGINETMTDEEIMAKALMVAQKTIEKKDELLKAKDKELKTTKEDLDTKNKFINQIAVSQNSLKVEEVAQIASKNGIKIGRNRLWDKLREWEMIKKNSKYDPKQEYIDRGYFEVVEGTRENSKGVFTYKTTRVLGKGQVYIINRLLKEINKEVM